MKKNTLLFSILILCSNLMAQSWHWVNPTTGFNQIHDIHFISANEGYAVGHQGKILHYINGEWSLMDSPVNTDLFGVSFVNPDMGWAVGAEGNILRYQYGTWSQVTSPITGVLNDVCCLNENHCWAAGSAILKYNGSEWLVDANLGSNETIGFINENLGWAGSSSQNLYKYENGIWSDDNSFNSGTFYSFHTLEKAGEYMLINGKTIEEEGLLYENDGNGWVQVPPGSCNSGISFADRQHGFGLQNTGPMGFDFFPTVHQYSDGVWQTGYVYEKHYNTFTAVEEISNTACMVSDNLGYIHKVEDGNHSIANGFMCDSIIDLKFVKPNLGFLAAHNSGLWKYDAGEWSNIFNYPDYTINVIDFQSEDWGYFGAYHHEAIFPFWPEAKLFSYNNGVISEIMFPDEYSFISSLNSIGEALIFTQRNTIFTYTNGQFTSEALAFPDSISDLKFMMPIPANSNKRNGEWEAAWMSVKRHNNADSGVIFYKYFSNTWQEVYTTSSGSFNDLCIFGHYQVVAVGTNGLIAVFDGTDWTEIAPLTDEDLLSVHVDENGNGWAVGKNGSMLRCEQGQWSLQNSLTTIDLNVVSFYDQSLGFIGGNEGALLCTDEKLPVGIFDKPQTNSLYQLNIYPNPAGNYFYVESSDPIKEVLVSMTDITGRVIFQKELQLMDKNKPFRISTEGCSPGIYLIKIANENKLWSGKMVIK